MPNRIFYFGTICLTPLEVKNCQYLSFWGLILLTGLTFGLFLFLPQISDATNSLDVVISEVAWMGTTNSVNDEWIELYNNTENPISLDGWQLVAQDGTPKIILSETIPANGFYLLERTDDTTIPNVPADQIYTGALGNTGEDLKLFDNFGNLIDRIDSSSGWFAGDNSTKQTMERINSLLISNINNWQTSQGSGGTPKIINSVKGLQTPLVTPSPTPTPTPTPTSSSTPSPSPTPSPSLVPSPTPVATSKPETEETKIVYPSGIIINEILPAPTGLDETEEWIVPTIQPILSAYL